MKRRLGLSLVIFFIFVACPDDEKPVHLAPPELIAPASGSTIAQNPPAFVWHASEETQILYQCEVAADSQFLNLVFISGSIFPPDTSCALDTALAAGTYYWRACVWEDC